MKRKRFVLGMFVLAAAIAALVIVVVSWGRPEQATVAPTEESTQPPTLQASAEPTLEPSPTPPPGFSLLFESDPDCTAPCWRGLRPGVTTWTEFSDWIESSGKLEGLECKELGAPTQCVWTETEIGIWVKVIVKDGVVSSLSLFGGHLVTDPNWEEIEQTQSAPDYVSIYDSDTYDGILGLRLGRTMELFGYPDSYAAHVAPNRDGGLITILAFFYEEEGIVLESPIGSQFTDATRQPSCTIEITPDLPILTVHFHDPKGRVPERYMGIGRREPWPGFGLADVTSCWID